MEISFDPVKSRKNEVLRGLGFDRVAGFDFASALFRVDDRRDYGEVRWQALGCRSGRVHSLVFTETATGIRVISFRKANIREVRRYDESSKSRS